MTAFIELAKLLSNFLEIYIGQVNGPFQWSLFNERSHKRSQETALYSSKKNKKNRLCSSHIWVCVCVCMPCTHKSLCNRRTHRSGKKLDRPRAKAVRVSPKINSEAISGAVSLSVELSRCTRSPLVNIIGRGAARCHLLSVLQRTETAELILSQLERSAATCVLPYLFGRAFVKLL